MVMAASRRIMPVMAVAPGIGGRRDGERGKRDGDRRQREKKLTHKIS
jgi:hypothetical protein